MPRRPCGAIIKPDNQECWGTTGEHGILPPASLQSNDPLKVFSLTLTTAYKRDQFLPPGQCEETESFNGEWRWGQKAKEEDHRVKVWAVPTRMEPLLHYKMLDTSVKTRAVSPRGRRTDTVCFVWTMEHRCFFVPLAALEEKVKGDVLYFFAFVLSFSICACKRSRKVKSQH